MATTIGLPSLTITFQAAAQQAANRSKKGYVGVFVRDAKAQGVHQLSSAALIPAELGQDNQDYIKRAFTGSDRGGPSKVAAVVIALLIGAALLSSMDVDPLTFYQKMVTMGIPGNKFPWRIVENFVKLFVPLLITSLALSLAFTFALYGFIRKTVSVEALPGLFIETIVLIPFSLGRILWLYWNGEGFLCSPTVREGFLLFLAGPVTSLPLVMFAYAARHMRLMTLGLLQYISPTCTFFLGIFMFGETLNPAALVTFIFIWLALLLYTVESWRQTRHLPH